MNLASLPMPIRASTTDCQYAAGANLSIPLCVEDKTFSISVSIGLVVLDADTLSQCVECSVLPPLCRQTKGGIACMYTNQRTGAATWRNAMGITDYKSTEENHCGSQRIVPIAQTETKVKLEVLLRLEDETGKIISDGVYSS